MKNMLWVTVAVAGMMVSTGCTNWEQKYKALDVEHQNLKGLYDNCTTSLEGSAAEKAQLGQQLSQSQKTIDELQKQIGAGGKAADKATGFEGMDVSFDAKAGTITVTLANEILFTPGQATLRKSEISELDKIHSVIQQRYAGKTVDVVGHTDTDPIQKSAKLWKDNWELSAERALTVLRYMVSHGTPAKEIRAVACGESRPVASNGSASGKAKNRRVEVVVHMK
jgi:chemotaxis protein MotB